MFVFIKKNIVKITEKTREIVKKSPKKIAIITPQIEPIVISKLLVVINDFSLDACQLNVSHYRAEILTIFVTYFGRNDDFIN